MTGYYKYIILAFLVGGVILVGAFLYQNYSYNQDLQVTTGNTPTQPSTNTTTENPSTVEDISESVVSVSNTKETSYGLFDSVEAGAIYLNVEGERTEFPIEATELTLMCSDQELYEVEELDLDQVNSATTLSFEQINEQVSSGDPVVVLSLANADDEMIAYAIIKKGTGCN